MIIIARLRGERRALMFSSLSVCPHLWCLFVCLPVCFSVHCHNISRTDIHVKIKFTREHFSKVSKMDVNANKYIYRRMFQVGWLFLKLLYNEKKLDRWNAQSEWLFTVKWENSPLPWEQNMKRQEVVTSTPREGVAQAWKVVQSNHESLVSCFPCEWSGHFPTQLKKHTLNDGSERP